MIKSIPLARLLSPPSVPWSHILLEFITDLPSSEGQMLTNIDQFSKKPKSSAKKTVEAVFSHVVWLMSDQGPHFAILFWKEFILKRHCAY